MKKLLSALIVTLLLTACGTENAGITEKNDISEVISEKSVSSVLTTSAASEFAETTVKTDKTTGAEKEKASEKSALTTVGVSADEPILGVIKTSNYFDEFYAYDHSYLIRSQEELDLFHEYMQENVFNQPVDFSTYSIAVEPLQSGSGSYKYECYSVDISENSIELSYGYDNVNDGDAVTCDMAMYYPYALIPNELLTGDDYGRWTAPSQAEINIYKMFYVNGTADYDPVYFDSIKKLGEKLGTGYLTFSVRFNIESNLPELYVQMELSEKDSAEQVLNELKTAGFDAGIFPNTVYPNLFRKDTPDEPLSLSRSCNIQIYTDCADVDDYDKMVEFFEAFDGETYDYYIRDEEEKDINTMYYRRWHYDANSVDEISEAVEKLSALPYEAASFNGSVTFMLSNE
ncbi:MAG: hypothetical protein IJ007_02065 [Oscillospiraceae bacterium]|nr:hypothetical protein [Oscillospiraceae bacterium]